MNVPRSTKDSRDYKLSQFGIDGSQDLSSLDEFSLPVPDKKIVLNQYNTPTCVGQACAMAKMISEYMLTNKWIGLSPYSVYGYYANNGGGMSIRYVVEVLYKWGCLPIENFSEKGDNPELNKALTKYRKEHPEAEEIAARYKIDSYAAVDLYDTETNSPENAPTLWETLNYKDGYRIIPETITVGTAFSKGEIGW